MSTPNPATPQRLAHAATQKAALETKLSAAQFERTESFGHPSFDADRITALQARVDELQAAVTAIDSWITANS